MLAAALRGNVRDRALEDLEQRLLHALAGDVARDARVLALARDLVDLVDVHDPVLGVHQVEVRRLEQAHEDVLDVLADVAGLGEARGVHDRERHLEEAGQRAGEQRLARAGRPDEQDVRLLQLDLARRGLRVDALIVVVHRHRERLLGAMLADHVIVEDALDLGGLRQRAARGRSLTLGLTLEDVVAQLDAFAADVHRRPGDEPGDFVLATATERAADRVRRRDALLHGGSVLSAGVGGAAERPASLSVASR